MSQDDASDVAASATGTIPAGLAHFEHSKGGESIQYSDLFIYYFFSRPNEIFGTCEGSEVVFGRSHLL